MQPTHMLTDDMQKANEYRFAKQHIDKYMRDYVLAPASCQLFADLLLERKPIIDPAPYAPAGRINAG